jgi:hypothetical protein
VREEGFQRMRQVFAAECKLDPEVFSSALGIAENCAGVTMKGKTIIYVHRPSLEKGQIKIIDASSKSYCTVALIVW